MGWATSRVADVSSDERGGEPGAGPGISVLGAAAAKKLREKRSEEAANRELFAGEPTPHVGARDVINVS
jgi:hypothetical protein